MDDQVLIHILETACSEENLIFQVVEQDRHLHVFINREPGQVLDYKVVGKKIYQALIRLSLTDIDGVCLYSRVLGEEEPDWEAKFRLPQGQQESKAKPEKPVQSEAQRQMSEAATYVMQDVSALRAEAKQSMAEASGAQTTVAISSSPAVAAPAAAANYPLSDEDGVTEAAANYEAAAPTVSVVAEKPAAKPETAASDAIDQAIDQAIDGDFELSEHCFIRNRMLLTADILPPSKTVAKQINGFHEFSMAEKQRMMPQLELFFKGAPTFSPEGLTEAQQSWFKEMDALTGDDARKGPIWLSRYCVNAEATLEVVARVFDPSLGATQQDDDKPAEEQSDPDAEVPGGAAHSISGSMAGAMAAPPRSPSRPGHGNHQARQHPTAQSMGQSAPVADPETTSASQWLWPGIVVIGSIVLMCLGMMLAKPAVMAEGLCTGSDYPEQCQLATQIVADQEVWDAMRNDARPLPDTGEMRENALAIAHSDCSLDGAINAGHNSLKAFNGEIAPVRSSELTELFPGVLLLDVEYPNADGPGNVRTACLLNNEPIPSSSQATQPLTIGSAVIPTSWPAEAYDNSTDQALELRSQQAFHPLFTFGSTLLFTTVGLFAAALLRMAVTTYNLTALSQAAIAMAIFEGFFELLLPLNGLLMFPFIVARKSLALGLTGAVVPGFKVDWSGGYMSVAGCVAVMVFVRFVLRWLMILTILGGSVV